MRLSDTDYKRLKVKIENLKTRLNKKEAESLRQQAYLDASEISKSNLQHQDSLSSTQAQLKLCQSELDDAQSIIRDRESLIEYQTDRIGTMLQHLIDAQSITNDLYDKLSIKEKRMSSLYKKMIAIHDKYAIDNLEDGRGISGIKETNIDSRLAKE